MLEAEMPAGVAIDYMMETGCGREEAVSKLIVTVGEWLGELHKTLLLYPTYNNDSRTGDIVLSLIGGKVQEARLQLNTESVWLLIEYAQPKSDRQWVKWTNEAERAVELCQALKKAL
jgi:hypothetical protein